MHWYSFLPSYAQNGKTKEYPDNIDEVTTIDVPAGSRIELMFNTFDLEEDRFTENYRFDFVEIKDDTTTLKLCGKMAVSNFQKATSNEMTVRFHSDTRKSYFFNSL